MQAISGVRRTRRQRRPSGAPPPLPRRIGPSTTAWLALAAILVSAAFLVSELTPWQRAGDQASTWLLRQLAAVRTPGLTGPADWISTTGSTWHPAIGVAVLLLVIVFRRWRHLLVFVLCVFFVEIVSGMISGALSRPRPYGVPVIGRWEGYSAPSPAVLTTTFLLMAGVYCLVVPGRPRSVAKAVVAAVVAVFCLSRLYLAVDHPDDVLSGIVLGVAIPVAAFRYFTPDEVFPVVYRRGRTAHVDVTGSRGRGDPAGRPRPARADRPGHHAGRPGVIGRIDAAATDRRGRPGPATCSASSTPWATSARTAGTSCGAPSCTAPWKTSTRSIRCGS